MPIITTADVYAGLKKRWDLVQNEWYLDRDIAALIPGGLWQGKVPQTVAGAPIKTPYARMDITEQDPMYNSTRNYTQVFEVMLTVWADRDGNIAEPGAVQQMIDLAYPRQRVNEGGQVVTAATVLMTGTPPSWPTPSVVRVLDMERKAGKWETDPLTRNMLDVLIIGYRWDLTLQGIRG